MNRNTDQGDWKQLKDEVKAYWGHSAADHDVAREFFLLRESMRQRCKGAVEIMNASSRPVRDRAVEAGSFPSGCACPRCNGAAYRVPRRLVDWLVSRFVWVSRYRCRSTHCGWEGNLRASRRPLLIQGPW